MHRTPTYIYIRGILAAVLSTFALVGCDVHEWPEEMPPAIVPFTLHLDFDTSMPIYEEIDYSNTRQEEDRDRRYIIGAYPYDKYGNPTRVADTVIVFTKSSDEDFNHSVELELPEGNYNFVVWTDYVEDGSKSDLYYKTHDFAEIILADRKLHVGNTDFRDGFRGEKSAMILANQPYYEAISRNVETETTIDMVRPMAKFKLIATDLKEFINHAKRIMAQKAADKGSTRVEPLEFNIENYRVVIRYNGFMPCSFNMFTNKPADAWTGVSFDSWMSNPTDSEVELGFDYVFVNGSESTVSVTVEVYDPDGDLVSRSNPIDVPIVRSKLTIVRGDFLTSKASGGVGIVPEFDGDYNYVVP